MVPFNLKTIDMSLAQELLHVYDAHCQKILSNKDAEIRELRAQVMTLQRQLESVNAESVLAMRQSTQGLRIDGSKGGL